MNNITRFSKIHSPCFSASHIVEMNHAMNAMTRNNGEDPRDIMIDLTLHELNILVAALEAK